MAKFIDVVLRLQDDFSANLKKAEKNMMNAEQTFNQVATGFYRQGQTMMAVGSSLTKTITTPVVAAATASIMAYADAEQAMGGIETLFKDSAATVFKNSETAYKRAGISAVQYMEQATSFSATLLQGLEGDTEQAAKYADIAMVNMSDNANKFGSDIQSLQNAYQGFAKDNFTMLDNLKLGYGGTQEEMARLINDSGVLNGEMEATAKNVKDIPYHVMIQAIDQIQKNLDIAGTTAKEAEETILGALGMTKASFMDLMAGLSTPDADINALVNNFVEAAKILAENVKKVLSTIWDNLPVPDWAKIFGGGLIAAGPTLMALGLLSKGFGKVNYKIFDFIKGSKDAGGVLEYLTTKPLGMTIKGLSDLHNKLNVKTLFGNSVKSVKGFGSSFVSMIKGIGPGITGLFGKLKSLPMLLKGFSAKGMLTGLLGGFKTIATVAAGAFGPIPILIGAIVLAVAALTGKFDWLKAKAEEIFPGIGVYFDSIREKAGVLGGKFMELVELMTTNVAPVFGQVLEALMPLLGVFAEYALVVIDAFLGALTGLMDFLMGVFTGNWEQAWSGIVTIFENVFGGLKGIAKSIINGVISILNIGIQGMNNIKVPDFIPVFGGKGIDIPEIPMLYTGTNNWPGGLAEIHDRGGEIVDLPRGSRVYPHDKSVQQAYTDGANQNRGNVYLTIPKMADTLIVREEADIDKIIEGIYKKVSIEKANKVGAY